MNNWNAKFREIVKLFCKYIIDNQYLMRYPLLSAAIWHLCVMDSQ